MAEQDETENEEDRQRFADRVLSFAEDAIYWAIAVVLLGGSAALLVAQVNVLLRLGDAPANTIMLDVLDDLLLIFIFVELLYAVRTSLRSHEIVAEPFLIVGILACIKEIVVLSVEAAKLLSMAPSSPARSSRSASSAAWCWCWPSQSSCCARSVAGLRRSRRDG